MVSRLKTSHQSTNANSTSLYHCERPSLNFWVFHYDLLCMIKMQLSIVKEFTLKRIMQVCRTRHLVRQPKHLFLDILQCVQRARSCRDIFGSFVRKFIYLFHHHIFSEFIERNQTNYRQARQTLQLQSLLLRYRVKHYSNIHLKSYSGR